MISEAFWSHRRELEQEELEVAATDPLPCLRAHGLEEYLRMSRRLSQLRGSCPPVFTGYAMVPGDLRGMCHR